MSVSGRIPDPLTGTCAKVTVSGTLRNVLAPHGKEQKRPTATTNSHVRYFALLHVRLHSSTCDISHSSTCARHRKSHAVSDISHMTMSLSQLRPRGRRRERRQQGAFGYRVATASTHPTAGWQRKKGHPMFA